MKYTAAAIVFLAVLTGCSTVGGLEGTGSIGEYARTADSVCKRLTGDGCDEPVVDTNEVNRTAGELEQIPYVVRSRSVPNVVQQLQLIEGR